MKKLLLVFLSSFLCFFLRAQSPGYWQQRVDPTIHVSLNDSSHTLDADISMRYVNNSPDTLSFIWMHLWPNAYKNDKTAFSDQFLENGRTDFYFSNAEDRGYINRLNFSVDGTIADIQDHPQHQDIVKLMLPQPIAPGGQVMITTPFHVKLPHNFSRSGFDGSAHQVTQWFPKPAVYDAKGWHPMPYLDQGEFYSEFGDYDVHITVPENFIVAATGILLDSTRTGDKKNLHYRQDNIHDFAWFADTDFYVLTDSMQLGNRVIQVAAYYYQKDSASWKKSIDFIKSAVRSKSDWIGAYPYDVATVVEKKGNRNDGGMEYPTITLLSNTNSSAALDFLINHEVGHNWFYGILASNERTHPWMDEGMNSFYDHRYMIQRYGVATPDAVGNTVPFAKKRIPDDLLNTLLETSIALHRDQPIETSSENFQQFNYNVVAYNKTAQWMGLLEQQLGQENFDKMMQAYFQAYQFRHPYPADFKRIAEEISQQKLDSLFSLLDKKGSLAPAEKKDLKLMAFFSLKDTKKSHNLFVLPVPGFNYYDKLMIGAALHNYSLPPAAFKFFIAPMYGTGSKALNGIGTASYTWHPGAKDAQVELGISGAHFTVDNFKDSTGKVNNQPFSKLVPFLRYRFASPDARSSVVKMLQWKTFFISETGLAFSRDPITNADIITYPKNKRYVNQLSFNITNYRVLYPYSAALVTEQGKGFVRSGFTGEYFFNYPKTGGMQVRLFAGKFFYTGDQDFVSRFETSRYHLNLTGPKGDEDYTYRNYFIGRNEFDGFSSQQIMIRDGAFKVRTDLLSNKIGKTDDWLSAINFTTTIPDKVNPLSVLPFKLPLKVFVDIGTYADAWKEADGTTRFLYDAGLQLSLYKNTFNIYAPILYSKVYKDYYKSTITEKRFWKTISFSINFSSENFKKLLPEFPW